MIETRKQRKMLAMAEHYDRLAAEHDRRIREMQGSAHGSISYIDAQSAYVVTRRIIRIVDALPDALRDWDRKRSIERIGLTDPDLACRMHQIRGAIEAFLSHLDDANYATMCDDLRRLEDAVSSHHADLYRLQSESEQMRSEASALRRDAAGGVWDDGNPRKRELEL